MRSLIPVVCVLAVFGVLGSMQTPTTAIDLPPRVVDLPTQSVPVSVPVAPAQDAAVCADGSCSPAASSGQHSAHGPVRRVVAAQPVRRVLGRVVCRVRGCR